MPFTQEGQFVNANIGTNNDVAGNQINNPTYNVANTTTNNFAPSIDLVARLNPVLNAAYDCGPRADWTCFEGTRVKVVQNIDDWAYLPVGRPLCLLDGPAGFGKSAIARTVAHQWDQSKRLAASFCFFRNSGDQSKGARLIPTLAYQLTRCLPETKVSIENALVDDPSLLNRPLEEQFQKLILDPILALPDPKLLGSPMVIIIDALDECEDRGYIPRLINYISGIDYSKFHVVFLFTSRSEEHIRKIFESSPVNRVTYQLSLSNTAFNVYNDIEHFLRSQCIVIYQENPRFMANIPLPWPSPSDLREIVAKVNGSFIFASTLMKYIREGKKPPERLKLIVESHDGVDGMYAEIVQDFWKDDHFPMVFSTIMLLHKPLSFTGLASLLELAVSEILIETLKIQSILVIPADDNTPVEVVHTSLRDFSTSRKRSGELFVNHAQNHMMITERCLKVMLTQSGKVVFEGEAAGYATKYWLEHLQLTLSDADSESLQYDLLVGILNSFATSQYYKTWFNTVLNGDARGPIKTSLQAIIQNAEESTGFSAPKAIKILKRIRKSMKSVSTIQLPFVSKLTVRAFIEGCKLTSQ